MNENGKFVRDKAWLVSKGYDQEEGINYGETFAPIARLEGVKTFLAYATYKKLKVYQMDIKSTFLNGIMEEYGIYVTQSKYIKDIMKIFGMDESRLVDTPMVTRW